MNLILVLLTLFPSRMKAVKATSDRCWGQNVDVRPYMLLWSERRVQHRDKHTGKSCKTLRLISLYNLQQSLKSCKPKSSDSTNKLLKSEGIFCSNKDTTRTQTSRSDERRSSKERFARSDSPIIKGMQDVSSDTRHYRFCYRTAKIGGGRGRLGEEWGAFHHKTFDWRRWKSEEVQRRREDEERAESRTKRRGFRTASQREASTETNSRTATCSRGRRRGGVYLNTP